MRTADFHFDLPPELIAQAPLAQRSASRLLYLRRADGTLRDQQFTDLPEFLSSQDLLVFNDTRVIPARLFGHKASGGKVEILLERVLGEHDCLAQIRASKSPKPGSEVFLDADTRLSVVGREGQFFHLRSTQAGLEQILQQHGHIPLPPYIERADEAADRERYQTVYATQPGAVAAPTAGLHFDQALLDAISAQGVETARVTLHVGAGTFQPVRVDDVTQHEMHAEYLEVGADTCAAIQRTRQRGGRVIAVGTTTVRALETAAQADEASATQQALQPFAGDSRIFIYPGYQFKVVDGLLTNFHLPESTLLMLVSALAGYAPVMQAYRHAVQQRYRFFSYGDAMLIL